MDKILFNSLLTSIQEALNATQKKQVDSWEKGDNSFSDHLFKAKNHQNTNIPIVHPEQEGHKDEIHSHLEPHGYTIKDYKSGIALDKHGRETRIGKALNATKAPEELKNKFQNDPSRGTSKAQSTTDDLRITLSRHPHHVAGMTSGEHCWAGKGGSCMDFEDGYYRDYLKQDVLHGTHVAYLHHKDDKDIKRPLARIALKKYTDDETGHSILRPENRTYGASSDAFTHSVHKFVNHHMPAHEDGVYMKNEHIYHDFGSVSHVIGHEKLKKMIDDPDSMVHHDKQIRHQLLNTALTPHHVDKMVDAGHNEFKHHPNASPKQIDKWVDDVSTKEGEHLGMLNHTGLKSHHINKIIDSKVLGPYTKEDFLRDNPRVKENHVMKYIDGQKRVSSAFDLFSHKSLSDKSLHSIIDRTRDEHANGGSDYRLKVSMEHVSKNPNLKQEHVDKILDTKPEDTDIYRSLMKHKLAPHQVDRIHSALPIHEFHEISGSAHKDNLQDNHIHSLINHYAKNPQSNDSNIENLIHNHSNFNSSHAEALDKHQFPKYLVAHARHQVSLKDKEPNNV